MFQDNHGRKSKMSDISIESLINVTDLFGSFAVFKWRFTIYNVETVKLRLKC